MCALAWFGILRASPGDTIGEGVSSCRRIVPGSPALAALMFQMGLGPRVVGITRWTRLPDGETRPVVGDSFDFDPEVLLSLAPDALLVQTSQTNRLEHLRRIRPELRVVPITLETLDDIRQAVCAIGALSGERVTGTVALDRFNERMDQVRRAAAGRPRPRVLFVTGTDRPFVAGPANFVAELIEVAGGRNVGAEVAGQGRWRRTDLESIIAVRPDVILCHVGSEQDAPPAVQYWSRWAEIPAVRAGRVHALSDPDWTIPSLRLAELAVILLEILHPEAAQALRSICESQTPSR